MNKQAIYTILSTVLTVIIIMGANAQTKEDKESGKSIRETLFKDGIGIKAVKAPTPRVSAERELSVHSAQELRALIFENYTPHGSKGAALKGAATIQVPRNAGTGKLPSESAAEEGTEAKESAKPIQTPPKQGNAKEEQ